MKITTTTKVWTKNGTSSGIKSKTEMQRYIEKRNALAGNEHDEEKSDSYKEI